MREVLLPIELLRFSAKKRRGVSQKRVEELRMQIEMEETLCQFWCAHFTTEPTWCQTAGTEFRHIWKQEFR